MQAPAKPQAHAGKGKGEGVGDLPHLDVLVEQKLGKHVELLGQELIRDVHSGVQHAGAVLPDGARNGAAHTHGKTGGGAGGQHGLGKDTARSEERPGPNRGKSITPQVLPEPQRAQCQRVPRAR